MMWPYEPLGKPTDEWYRLCCNEEEGCFMARWNGIRWSSDPYLIEGDTWTSDTVKVSYWLKTPIDVHRGKK